MGKYLVRYCLQFSGNIYLRHENVRISLNLKFVLLLSFFTYQRTQDRFNDSLILFRQDIFTDPKYFQQFFYAVMTEIRE